MISHRRPYWMGRSIPEVPEIFWANLSCSSCGSVIRQASPYKPRLFWCLSDTNPIEETVWCAECVEILEDGMMEEAQKQRKDARLLVEER